MWNAIVLPARRLWLPSSAACAKGFLFLLGSRNFSAGAVCQNILVAAHSLGYVANWITEWYAYDTGVTERLGLKAGERIAGYIYIGTSAVPLEERVRPNPDALVTRFEG